MANRLMTALAIVVLLLIVSVVPVYSQQEKVEWHKPRPFLGAQKTLVVLVDFTDVRMRISVDQARQIVEVVNRFVKTASYGKAWLDYTVYPKVITLPQTMAYYGAPEPGAQRGDNRARINEYHLTIMRYIKERERIDITQFKHLIIIHAGKDEAAGGSPNDIWSHCFSFPILNDWIEQYGFDRVESELRRQGGDWIVELLMHRTRDGKGHLLAGIETVAEEDFPAVMAHEFTHSMWISDHYVYSKDGYSQGSEVGVWTNMDYGSFLNPPVDIDGWSKYILGWIEPVMVNKDGEYVIHTLDKPDEPHALIIPINDEEYYFVHARRLAGMDAGLPGPGVLVFRINKYIPRNEEGKGYFIRLIDANPNTPPECREFTKESVRLCEGLDAPHFDERHYSGRWQRFEINLLNSEFVSEEGYQVKVIEFDEQRGVARLYVSLGGVAGEAEGGEDTETTAETTVQEEIRTVTRTVTGTVVETFYTTTQVVRGETRTVVVTVTAVSPPRQQSIEDYVSIAIVLASLLFAAFLLSRRRGIKRFYPPPPPPTSYRFSFYKPATMLQACKSRWPILGDHTLRRQSF